MVKRRGSNDFKGKAVVGFFYAYFGRGHAGRIYFRAKHEDLSNLCKTVPFAPGIFVSDSMDGAVYSHGDFGIHYFHFRLGKKEIRPCRFCRTAFFNFFWTILFFNLQMYLFAFIWLAILWVMILLMIISFYRIDKTAAYLQIPYLLWVSFAGYLNFMVWILNK